MIFEGSDRKIVPTSLRSVILFIQVELRFIRISMFLHSRSREYLLPAPSDTAMALFGRRLDSFLGDTLLARLQSPIHRAPMGAIATSVEVLLHRLFH
ncbi:hypothetical protein [Nocardia terpenica]|uniref:hypothetical protein n=1 Tax=Nocardia terpenica TaxID=455432 RepID=UPI001E4EB385|nr:hypothetical protein [Nocardia terpenica]